MSLDQPPEFKKSRVSISQSKNLHPEQSKLKSIANLNQKATSRQKVRRQSYGFGGVPGIRPVERTSQAGLEFKRPPLLYLPTYQLAPALPFNAAKVKEATDEVLDQLFTGHVYNVNQSPPLTLRIAGEIMRKVKNMQFSRYRVITVVTLGQKRSQSYNNAVLFLWDHERDNYVDVQREAVTVTLYILNNSRSKAHAIVEALTGHYASGTTMHKMKLSLDPSCRACGEEEETMEHILCESDVLAAKRMYLLGGGYPKPGDSRYERYCLPLFTMFFKSVENKYLGVNEKDR